MEHFFRLPSLTSLIGLLILLASQPVQAQIDNNGCVKGNFGIDAGLYSGTIEYGDGTPALGTMDWFQGASGHGIILETNTNSIKTQLQGAGDPAVFVHTQFPHDYVYAGQYMIDGLFARDNFGGSGFVDPTAYETASKNGEDPAIWDPGPMKVLGKNDLIDVMATMWRDGTDMTGDLMFAGIINRAEPGGDAYMDFEFYIEPVSYTPGVGFSSGGPQLGHTAFTFDGSGNITKVGDFIYNMSLVNGGSEPNVEVRLWVSYADYIAGLHPSGYTWGPYYDGAFTGAPYGYASIIPDAPEICGIVNLDLQTPLAPPWGTKNTKYNTWGTTYQPYSVVELGLNMTHFGIDHASLSGFDPCYFPIHTLIVKTRTSASFTSQLKDFAGPYEWGQPSVTAEILGNPLISCLNPVVTLVADPIRNDVTYQWTTLDGNILTDPTLSSIQTTQPGTYTLVETLLNGCPTPASSVTVSLDPAHPLFGTPTTTTTVSCTGSNGTIDLTVVGGTSPFTYLWSNSATTQDLSGLIPGTYTVTITDAVGCQKTATATIPAKTPINITPSVTATACYGTSTGSVSVSVSGQSPFTYLWSNGQSTQNLLNVAAGTYTVTVTDAVGCTQTLTATVSQPTALAVSAASTNETNASLNNGTATLTVSGGTSPYTFLWSNSSTSQNQTGLSRGTYTVTVTDAHSCTSTASVTIWEPEVCNDGIDNDGNGFADCYDATCKPSPPGTITPSNANPCVGNTVTYSVTNDPTLTQYVWTIPAGATLNSGQGTNSISVTWTLQIGGQVCVKADKYGCQSNPTCLTVIPSGSPDTPDDILVH